MRALLVIVRIQRLGSDTPEQLPREDAQQAPRDVQGFKDGPRLVRSLPHASIATVKGRTEALLCSLPVRLPNSASQQVLRLRSIYDNLA